MTKFLNRIENLFTGQLVTQMFKDAHRASHMILGDESIENVKPFPKPFSREFVLKVNVPRPYVYSQPSPQRIYCRLTVRVNKAKKDRRQDLGDSRIRSRELWIMQPATYGKGRPGRPGTSLMSDCK